MYICSFPLYVYIYIIIFDINVNLTKIQQKMKRMFDKTSNGINLMKKKIKSLDLIDNLIDLKARMEETE